MYQSKHRKLDVEIIRLYDTERMSMNKIADMFGIPIKSVDYRLFKNGVQKRTISESSVGKPKSIEHRKAVSKTRIDGGLAKGSKNPKWRGGVSAEYDKKMSAIKRDPRYKAWAKAVKSIGHCEACPSTKNLEAHHVLPKALFPHLIHDINNGKCLCKKCHQLLHGAKSISGELLETLTVNDEGNQQPSRVETRKVQRLLGDEYTHRNTSLECPTRK